MNKIIRFQKGENRIKNWSKDGKNNCVQKNEVRERRFLKFKRQKFKSEETTIK